MDSAEVPAAGDGPPGVGEKSQGQPGGPVYASALAHSDPARQSARALLVVGGVVYASWHFVHKALMPAAIDPLPERIAFFVFAAVLVALSYRPSIGRRLVELGYAVAAAGTAHYFSLVARNQIAPSYLVGTFVVLASVSVLLISARVIIAYSIFAVVLALTAALLSAHASTESRLELVLGVCTVQIGIGVSAWRNQTMEDVRRELDRTKKEVKQLRGLLPICMHCNRIRGQNGDWNEIQSYVEANTEAAFTHSLCNECLNEHYPI